MVTLWLVFSVPPAVPPPVVSAAAPATEFSAERARAHLEVIARQPRPVGSAAHAETRAYLAEMLAELGLEAEVQRATGIRRAGDVIRAAPVANLMARLPGTDSTGAIVLLAHYDSVPNAPGAADAGHGVVAVLETLRALQAGPRLRNDLIALFTDAEEVGLLGAQAWVDEHPWAQEVGLVLNAEGRGHTGPVHMFRTTPNNGGMIRMLAAAAPYPSAESAANEIFQRMPNDTDLTVFDQAGYAGMDFANVHGLTHYHTPLDNLDNADARTLQHHGSYLLSLSRAFGDHDLGELAAPDRSYFSLPGLGLVHYPMALALPLALLAAVFVVVSLLSLGRRGRWSWGGSARGLLHFAGALLLLPLLASVFWLWLSGHVPETRWFAHGEPYDSGRFLLGTCLLVMALYAASIGWLRLQPLELLSPVLGTWAGLGLLTAWLMPGAAYLFLWPLLFATLGLVLSERAVLRGFRVHAVVLSLAAIPLLVLQAPQVEAAAVALTLDAIPVITVALVLGLGLLALQFDFLRTSMGRVAPLALAVAGLAVLIMAQQDAGFDAERKKPNGVHYFADLDAGEAVWYSHDPAPDEWTRHFLGDDPQRGALPAWAPAAFAGADGVLQQSATVTEMRGTRAELLSATRSGEGRRLRLKIIAPPGNHSTVITFPGGTEIIAVTIDGRSVPADPAWDTPALQLLLFALPEEGIELELVTEQARPLPLQLRVNLRGLPDAEGAVPPRPDHMMPGSQLGDLTRLQRRLEL
jgi:hypothetical protein